MSGIFQEHLCPEAEKESQDAGQEGCQNRKIFLAEADCGTRCRHIRHRRGRLQLAFPVATEARNPAELLCRRPFGHGGADHRRQGGIQRCICARSGVEQVIDKGKSVVSTAVNGIANFAKSNAHVLVIVGVFLLLLLLVMSAFSSCSILFSGTTQVSGQTMYSAEDRDIRGAEQDYKKLEKELDKKIKRTPTDHPGYNEYQYHLDPIEHDPWQLTSFLTTLYDDYTGRRCRAN